MDTKYFIVWVEGLSLRSGEKIKYIVDGKIYYTTKMTEALRIPADRKGEFDEILKHLISGYTFHGSNYAPQTASIYGGRK